MGRPGRPNLGVGDRIRGRHAGLLRLLGTGQPRGPGRAGPGAGRYASAARRRRASRSPASTRAAASGHECEAT